MDLETMLADKLNKLVDEKVPANSASKEDITAAVEALRAELPELVKAAVAEAAPVDRVGVGSKSLVADPEPTFTDDPVKYLLAKAGRIKSAEEWTAEEKAVIAGITITHMLRGMTGSGDDEDE